MKNYHITASLICIALGTASSSVLASDSQLYFGAGIAQTSLEINQQNIRTNNFFSNQSEFENSGNGYTLFIGSRLDRYLSLELGYTTFGNIQLSQNNQTKELFSVDSVFMNTSLSYPITLNTDVYAKLGISQWNMQSKDGSFDDNGTGLNYGAGFDVNLYGNKNRTLRLEWIHHEYDEISLTSSDSLTASMVFHFN